MTKKDITRSICKNVDLDQALVQVAAEMVLSSVIDAIVKEWHLESRGFGVFEVHRRAARKARNPRSGETI